VIGSSPSGWAFRRAYHLIAPFEPLEERTCGSIEAERREEDEGGAAARPA